MTLVLLLPLVAGGCGGGGDGGAALPPEIEGPVAFRRLVVDPSPPGGGDCCTDVCAVGDLDGDGYADLVVGGEHADGPGLFWYRFPEWIKRPLASGEFTTDMQLADMDGDGRLDVVVGDTSRGLVWVENPDDPEADWPLHVLGEGYVHDVGVGDIEGDGDVDVVTCDKKQVVLWTAAGGAWTPRVLLTREGEGLALADLDRDGDLDLVQGGFWLEAPGDPATGPWTRHDFAADWPQDARVAVGDIDGDGRADVALTASEGPGEVAWFAAPADPRADGWTRTRVGTRTLTGAHSLQLADLDGDDATDLVTAEMHTGGKLVLAYLQRDGAWQEMVLSRDGSHNMRAVDIGGDGDVDLVGKNYGGPGRVFEMWENLRVDRGLIPEWRDAGAARWEYRPLDTARGDDQFGMMGLVTLDADRDGWTDVAAGSLLYLNPGEAGGAWTRVALPAGADAAFVLDVDGDRSADLVALRADQALWLEAADAGARSWTEHVVAAVPRARTQGWRRAPLLPGGGTQLVFTRGMAAYCLTVPERPEAGDWPLVRIADGTEEEGLDVGDLDGDGDLDLVTSARDGFHLRCWLNPGPDAAAAGDWASVVLATSPARLDRVRLADIDGDGRDDVVVSEESQDLAYDAGLAWYRAPEDPLAGRWERHAVILLRSANSLDVADFDGDGRPDLATAEHTDMRPGRVAADNRTLVLLNRDGGRSWEREWVDVAARSSHLGARAVDLDRDGDLDLVSPAWRQYRTLHAWYNPGRAH